MFLFIVIVLLIIALLLFAVGPAILEWFAETVEEWEQVLKSLHKEK